MAQASAPTISRLPVATLTAPPGHPVSGKIEVFSYLVRHSGALALVDTGLGAGNDFINEAYAPVVQPIDAALARVGIAVADVDFVVISHLHFDHCGGISQFPDTPIYVQAEEAHAAKERFYTVSEWAFPPGIKFELISGNVEPVPGLTILSTPGHTPGHQSLMVEKNGTRHLIAAQAAYNGREWNAGGDEREAHPGLKTTYLETIAGLKSGAPGAVYFSHDKETWRPSPGDQRS